MDERDDVDDAADIAGGNTGVGAVEVSTIVVATAVAPFLEGDSVITDVISAVVATGAGEEGCAGAEDAGAAELEGC